MVIKKNSPMDCNHAVGEAFILAAGFGRRLLPLTKDVPKPLVKINKKPMIDYIFDALDIIGIEKIYINTHYHYRKIFDFLEEKKMSNIYISYEKTLLDTGGGIKKVIDTKSNQALLIINCDAILFNDYPNLLRDLQKKFDLDKMDALLAFSSPKNAIGYKGNGDFMIADDGMVIESDSPNKMVFMGISVLNTKNLELVESDRFSLVEIWNKLIKKKTCFGIVYESVWYHAGSTEAINLANQHFEQN